MSSTPRDASLITYRCILLAVAVAAGFLTIRTGVSRGFGNSQPAVALTYDQSDSRAHAAMAAHYVAAGLTPRTIAAARDEATRALQRDLTDPRPYEVLATIADTQGRGTTAARLMAISNTLSRRSLLTRLWYIESAVSRGDVEGALRNFDIGLRSSMDARAILFPILWGALDDASLIAPIARLLDQRPAWAPAFLLEASNSGVATANLAQVLLRLKTIPAVDGGDLRQIVIARLVAQNQVAAARRFAAALAGRPADATLVHDPAFTDTRALAPFAWDLDESADTMTADRSATGRGGIEIGDPSGRGGIAAAQALTLPTGGYTLAVTAPPSTEAAARALHATLTCTDGTVLTDTPVAAGRTTAALTVPATCGAQWLRLTLPFTGNTDDATYRVARVDVIRS